MNKSIKSLVSDNLSLKENDIIAKDTTQPSFKSQSYEDTQIAHPSQANYGAKIQSEITSNYLREYMLIKPTERYQFIEKIFYRNSQSLLEFLIHLKTTCSSNFYEGMFSLIHELNQNNQCNLQIKTRLFVQSLLYYRNEMIQIQQELLQNSMSLLAQRPNSEQTLGLANYVFFNEVDIFYKLQDELLQLDNKNIGIIPLMAGTFSQFRIDPQVIRLLPNTLLCLNKPFIQILKQDQGLRLIRDIPINVVGDFVQICALSSASNYGALNTFINAFNEIFIQKWDYLDQDDFSLFIYQLSHELKERNQRWVGKLYEIIQLVRDLTQCYQEKGLKNKPDLIVECLQGNYMQIQQYLNIPKHATDLSEKNQVKALNTFKKLNNQCKEVKKFCLQYCPNKYIKSQTEKKIEKFQRFKFLTLQNLCIRYVLEQKEKFQFINFGVGNGKTLLCSTIGIIFAIELNIPVFIVGKNDHLILRDEKNFEQLIINMGLNVNVNQYDEKCGLYYLTQKYLESIQNEEKFLKLWKTSLVIIDEYDWIFFDGSVNNMFKTINFFKQTHKMIGFTGSTLSLKEKTCLEAAFQIQQIIFPSLNQLTQDKKIQHMDQMITTTQKDYCQKIYEISEKQIIKTPVIIVAQEYYTHIESYFKKYKELQCYSMRNSKGTKIEAQLTAKLTQKNQNNKYGVFLLTESQGRGTDLKTSQDIEFNGGLYLIIADIFSKRSTEQIVGRVGRLENKGQWHHVIYQQGSQESIEQIMSFKQDFLENENHIKLSKLQTLLNEEKTGISNINNEKIKNSLCDDGKDIVITKKNKEQKQVYDNKLTYEISTTKIVQNQTNEDQLEMHGQHEEKQEYSKEQQLKNVAEILQYVENTQLEEFNQEIIEFQHSQKKIKKDNLNEVQNSPENFETKDIVDNSKNNKRQQKKEDKDVFKQTKIDMNSKPNQESQQGCQDGETKNNMITLEKKEINQKIYKNKTDNQQKLLQKRTIASRNNKINEVIYRNTKCHRSKNQSKANINKQ